MDRRIAAGIALTLSLVAAIILGAVANHEYQYAQHHPYAYGPAHQIAWAAVAGIVLCVAVGVVALAHFDS